MSNWLRVDDGNSTTTAEYQTWAVRDAALDWIAGVGNEPWFAMVCFQAPHSPFHNPPPLPPRPPFPPPTKRELFERMLTEADAALGAPLPDLDRVPGRSGPP